MSDPMSVDWSSHEKRPKAYELVDVRTESGEIFHGLCWSPAREDFIEPITNGAATEVIGKVVAWRYPPAPEDPSPF